jgi:hypothetical protein
MITAKIQTQTRTIKVTCNNDKDHAISSLQNSVKLFTKEDGRCKFIVLSNEEEIYSWEYQPTIREEKKAAKAKQEPKYKYGSLIYVLRNGDELLYENLYDDAHSFDSVKEAREFMKERGYFTSGYQIVYEYGVSKADGSYDYGFGLGFTREEAKENLNENLKYYDLELTKYGYIKEL